jgi:transposase
LLAVKLGLEGELGLEQIAASVGRARSAIQRWFDAYREGGVEKLLIKSKGNGPEGVVPEPVLEEMTRKLSEGQWRTGEQARQWLEKTHRIKLKLSSIYPYLKKLGGRLKVPRPVHQKKDQAAAETFKTELAEKLEALQIEADRRVRVWVQDEMRYGLQPVTRRVWSLQGVRVVKPICPRYEWGYTFGALEVGGEGCEFSFLPTVSKEATRLHLEQISRGDAEAVHVIIWDGAGFHHRDGDPEVPENIRLIQLPAYSPELNPAEKLWDILKDGICNRLFETIEALEEALTAKLRLYWEESERVVSLIGSGWLLAEVNATSPIDNT